MEIAVGGLIKALDESPRANWHRAIEMAMTAMKDLGYSEGYRVGFREEEKTAHKVAKNAAGGIIETYDGQRYVAATVMADLPRIDADNKRRAVEIADGEDKALANERRTPEEENEDRGFEFIRQIARQIGVYTTGFTPETCPLSVSLTEYGELKFNFHPTQLKGLK